MPVCQQALARRQWYAIRHESFCGTLGQPSVRKAVVAAGQAAVGQASAAASRIPSALATLLCALMLYGMVLRTHGRREALAAAVILLTSILVIQIMIIGFDGGSFTLMIVRLKVTLV